MNQTPTLQMDDTQDGALRLSLGGAWTMAHLQVIEGLLHTVAKKKPRQTVLNGAGLSALDVSAAWLLVKLVRGKGAGVEQAPPPEQFSEEHATIFALAAAIEHPPTPHCALCGTVRAFFIDIGKSSAAVFHGWVALAAFFGQLCMCILRTVRQPTRLRVRSVVYHINDIGLRAIPIVVLLAFLLSMVMGYQGANQLEKFGAKIFTIDLVVISLLREMAVIITAILIAGRSGSAFAAQIGVMQVNDEVDALRTIGLDPFEILILPRILAIIIALPILTLLADLSGMFGALFISTTLLDLSPLQFMERLQLAASNKAFLVGLLKAPVFALLIGMAGCLQGMQVKNSAAEVGARTTMAVVQSIFLVVLFDAAFSILFTLVGI